MLQPLIPEAWDSDSLPSEWTDGIIIKVPKKITCVNLIIGVVSAVLKIIAKVILKRIKDSLISTIDAEQVCFRAGSSCTDHIISVRIIIKQCKEFRSELHMICIDFEKAFESVHRDCISIALRSRGISDKIIA